MGRPDPSTIAPTAMTAEAVDVNSDLGAAAARLEREIGLAATPALVDRLRRYLDRLSVGGRRALRLCPAASACGQEGWSALVEALLNHETCFLRDGAQFELLARLLPDLASRAALDGRFSLRVWSAGCATGEEAYSVALVIAKALLRDGLAMRTAGGIEVSDPWRVEVVGSDLSPQALAVAEAGLYPVRQPSPFRQVGEVDIAFFPPLPGSACGMRQVHPCLRRLVRFEQGNVARDPRPPGRFDIVICRNMLLYLTPEARTDAARALMDALEPGGCLLVGPTDVMNDAGALETIWSDHAIIHRRRADLRPVHHS